MTFLKRLRIDPFLLAIITAAVAASLLPAGGPLIPVLDWATKIAIGALFFLYGVRLHPKQALEGLRHWRLHTTILAFTYVAFPLVGMTLGALVPNLISPALYPGLLYVCLVPSTVQSSIAFTSVARGNVAGAIVSASFSNLIGVALTPLLVIALMRATGGGGIDPSSVWDVVLQLLIPFVLGQMSRRWTAGFVSRHQKLKLFDQASIVLVVYAAFSAGIREGIWTMLSGRDLLVLIGACLAVLALMLWATWAAAKALGFDREDRIAIQFCGTKKSLASGLPMATVLFAGQPIGLIMLPLMVFHQAQLMACGYLAGRYARGAEASEEAGRSSRN